jgi:hypothetical protein
MWLTADEMRGFVISAKRRDDVTSTSWSVQSWHHDEQA